MLCEEFVLKERMMTAPSLQYLRSEDPKGVLYVIDLFDHNHLFCLLKRGDLQSLENFL